MLVWVWYYALVLNNSFFSVVTSLISLCLLTFSLVFPQAALLISSKRYFSKSFFALFLRSVFISICGFSQEFWLNLIILCKFSKTNPWLNACLGFLIYITYSDLSCKLAASFRFFQFSFFQVKMITSCNFSKYWTSTSRKYLIEKYLWFTQNYFLEAFAALLIHISFSHPNT